MQVLVMNPGKPVKKKKKKTTTARKKNEGVTPMAKKRRKARKKSTRRNPAVKTRTVTQIKYRKARKKRRNPARRSMPGSVMQLKTMLPNTVAVIGGLVGTRYIVSRFLPNYTGYTRAAIMAAGALVIQYASKMLLKGKNKHLGTFLMMGGLGAAVLEVVDTATGGSYRNLYSFSGGTQRYIPGAYASLPSMNDYGYISNAGNLSDNYGYIDTNPSALAAAKWGDNFVRAF